MTPLQISANRQSREVFMLLLQANSMVLEYKEIARALVRNKDDAELSMMRLVVQARASAMEADMEDEEGWLHQYSKDCLGTCLTVSSAQTVQLMSLDRVRIGHQCCRIAITTMILSEIYDWPVVHPRIMKLVERLAEQLEACRESPSPFLLASRDDSDADISASKQEVGLSWPFIVNPLSVTLV
jgi:hypothetical protein